MYLHFKWGFTFLSMMIPSWLCSLVVISNMAPPSPGTMLYSTSAFFPMSRSWALIRPTADPTADDSGTRRWKMPAESMRFWSTCDWCWGSCFNGNDSVTCTNAFLTLNQPKIKISWKLTYILDILFILSPFKMYMSLFLHQNGFEDIYFHHLLIEWVPSE